MEAQLVTTYTTNNFMKKRFIFIHLLLLIVFINSNISKNKNNIHTINNNIYNEFLNSIKLDFIKESIIEDTINIYDSINNFELSIIYPTNISGRFSEIIENKKTSIINENYKNMKGYKDVYFDLIFINENVLSIFIYKYVKDHHLFYSNYESINYLVLDSVLYKIETNNDNINNIIELNSTNSNREKSCIYKNENYKHLLTLEKDVFNIDVISYDCIGVGNYQFSLKYSPEFFIFKPVDIQNK